MPTTDCSGAPGGDFIYGGEGDDRIIISGDHTGQRVFVDGGPGQDRVLVTGNDRAWPVARASGHQTVIDAPTILLLAAVIATLLGWVILPRTQVTAGAMRLP